MNLYSFTYKFFRRVKIIILFYLHKILCHIHFKGNNVDYQNFGSLGTPYIIVARGGSCKIGRNFRMNNDVRGNPIGGKMKCIFFVDRDAKLTIGENVGISQTTLICHKSITIGNNVMIGGGAKIYDTDFHSIDHTIRGKNRIDQQNTKRVPVIIKNNAFIGAYSLILKGVTVGENSVIGAGSVVTKSVPDNQIWAGNPAKFIKNI